MSFAKFENKYMRQFILYNHGIQLDNDFFMLNCIQIYQNSNIPNNNTPSIQPVSSDDHQTAR